MGLYKLLNALPQSLPGNSEFHYGHKCEVRVDGIYAELDDITGQNFVTGGRAVGPIAPLKKPEVVVDEVEVVEEAIVQPEEVPQTAKDVIENGSGKRGRPAKVKD